MKKGDMVKISFNSLGIEMEAPCICLNYKWFTISDYEIYPSYSIKIKELSLLAEKYSLVAKTTKPLRKP
ncbi:hypothetical protein N9Y89_01400 [bacterium]|nr:hypothetical protein [bacterium]